MNSPRTPRRTLCPRCLMPQALTRDTPYPTAVDATTALTATGSGQWPEPCVPKVTEAHVPGLVAGSASIPTDTSGDC